MTSGIEVGNGQLFLDKAKACLSSELGGEMMTFEQLVEQRGLKQGMEQGIEQGIEQGMEQVIEQGMQQGIQQGALQEKTAIANKLLATGMAITNVVLMKGLSSKIVLQLSKSTTVTSL